MSHTEVRIKINQVQNRMEKDKFLSFISDNLIQEVNLLMATYGNFLGNARAKHRDYLEELNAHDNNVEEAFTAFVTANRSTSISKKIIGLLIKRISEILSFVEELNSTPKKEVSKKLYEKLLEENKANKKVIEILSKVKGIPELNDLLEKSCAIGIEVDESWALAICSINLIEAGVNKKLEDLKESTDGSFEKKYRRLVSQVKAKEHRTIQHMLPMALYKGIRNKLDHASHTNRVTSEESKKICKMVMDILDELFTT